MSLNNKTDKDIVEECYKKALGVLNKCAHPVGIKASANTRGYPHVWARDSMITLLGGILTEDKKIINALKSSINTLRKNQTKLGLIPNNIHVKTKKINFQAYADTGLWFIIGNSIFYKQIKDLKFLKKNYSAIKKILRWYEYQDVDQSGLITMSEGSDWEDLFAVRGKGLYVNVLYYLALRNASFMAESLKRKNESRTYLKKAKKVRSLINKHFWYNKGRNFINHVNFGFGDISFIESFISEKGIDSLKRKMILPQKFILKKSSYYLPYLSFRNFGEWFDSFGNIMAILSGVADKKQTETIIKFIKKYNLVKPYPIKAIYPPIFPKDKDWRYYYKFDKLNLPNQYHNGGIWPFLGGFWVTALYKAGKKKLAQKELINLAKANKINNWQFNEWLHGKTGKPMGMAEQAWNAGTYILAYHYLKGDFKL